MCYRAPHIFFMPLEIWQQELQRSIRTLDDLERLLPLPNKIILQEALRHMRLSITPHTLSLIDFRDPADPLLLMSVPRAKEIVFSPEELEDPIGDETKSPVPFLTHRYPDRVLIYATFACSQYCRFCFRRSKTGHATPGPSPEDAERILEYLAEHPKVDEAILSGGDPLTLVDAHLETWLRRLRAIPSIRRIRIHTRVPVNLPSRITPELVSILRGHMDATHPIYLVTHFNHPREIAEQNIAAVARLADAGIVIRNQSVLLKGVNDNPDVLAILFKSLTNIRVVPYYLHQLDLARGTNHLRVPIKRGMELMKKLQGRVTGIALPRYMLDIPGGKGKIPIAYPYLQDSDSGWLAESPFGERVSYQEPRDYESQQI